MFTKKKLKKEIKRLDCLAGDLNEVNSLKEIVIKSLRKVAVRLEYEADKEKSAKEEANRSLQEAKDRIHCLERYLITEAAAKEDEICSLTAETVRLQDELDSERSAKEDEIDRLRTETDRLQKEVKAEKSSKEHAIRSLKEEISQLQRDVNAEKAAREEAASRLQKATDRLRRLESDLEAEKAAKEDVMKRLTTERVLLQGALNAEKSTNEKAISRLQKATDRLRLLESDLEAEKAAKEDVIKSFQEETSRLHTELNAENAAKEDAIRRAESTLRTFYIRLNGIASSRVLADIQNIPDLSDKYRPTELAEATKRLYTNEWKHAFDELKRAGFDEEDIVYRLQDVFMDIFRECRQITGDEWIQRLQKIIESNDMVSEMPSLTTAPEFPDLLKQQLFAFRIIRADDIKDRIAEGFIHSGRLPYLNEPPYNQWFTRVYVNKCIELSWLMNIHDPPLYLSTNSEDLFDLNLFREYEGRGSDVAKVIWPVLYLHENGDVLCKGVACRRFDSTQPTSTCCNGNERGISRGGYSGAGATVRKM